MSALKLIIQNVWFVITHLSKKTYTTGMIVLSGTVAVAVMFIGVNGLAGSTNIEQESYEIEEDNNDVGEKEQVTEEVTAEDSSLYYVQWAMADYEAASIESSGQVVTGLAKEETSEKILKTSGTEALIENEELSVKDYTALLRIVEAEATSEDLKGKVLIANVVMNRVATKRFPNTIYEVVHQKIGGRAQFSPIDDGRYYSVPITSSTEDAVGQALEGTNYSEGALFFVAKSLASERAGSWFDNNLNFIKTHGVHSFYKY